MGVVEGVTGQAAEAPSPSLPRGRLILGSSLGSHEVRDPAHCFEQALQNPRAIVGRRQCTTSRVVQPFIEPFAPARSYYSKPLLEAISRVCTGFSRVASEWLYRRLDEKIADLDEKWSEKLKQAETKREARLETIGAEWRCEMETKWEVRRDRMMEAKWEALFEVLDSSRESKIGGRPTFVRLSKGSKPASGRTERRAYAAPSSRCYYKSSYTFVGCNVWRHRPKEIRL
jgi:hypothetical protein